MRIDIITLFPAMFQGPLTESILKRAQDEEKLEIVFHDLRQFGLGKYHQVDDSPYGGGAGMLMRADVIVPALEKIAERKKHKAVHDLFFSEREEVKAGEGGEAGEERMADPTLRTLRRH